MQEKKSLTVKQKKIAAGCALAVFILLSAAVFWFVGRPMIRFVRQPELFQQWVDGLGFWGKAAYVGMCILQVVVAIIPGEPLEICGGYAFGGVWGSVLCMLGLFLGSIVVFWMIRRLGQPVAEIFFSQEKLEKLHFLKHSPKRNFLFWLVFTIPGTPKDLLCYFAGLTDVSWGTWLLLCSVGRLPSVLTSTVGGSALGGRSYLFAALVFGGTLVFSLAGLLIYRNLCQKHERKGNAGDKPAE